MKARRGYWVLLFIICFLTVYLPTVEERYVWQQTAFAQSAVQTIPIAFTGGAPGCTVLIPAVAGKQVWVNNGLLVIPAIGTGMTVQFLSSTDGGQGSSCNAAGVTRTAITGFYAGAQVGTTATNVTIIPFNGSPAMVTPIGQGLVATVSIATIGTTSQSVGGHLTFYQQ